MRDIPRKIIAKNRRTGNGYVVAEKTKYGDYYEVSTERAWPQTWIIDARNVILLPQDKETK